MQVFEAQFPEHPVRLWRFQEQTFFSQIPLENCCLPSRRLQFPQSAAFVCSRLTAFVLKSFAQSRGFIFIDPKELLAAKDWIIQHQKEDGSFPAMGRILNKDIQVGKQVGR